MGFTGYLILGVIIVLCALIMIWRIKKIKKGQYCSCGYKDCPYKTKCIEKD